jgi:MFS family permease
VQRVTGEPVTEVRPVTGAAPSRTDLDAELSTAGLFATLLGAGLSIVDFFIVNIALPTIDRTLHPAPATLQLVVASYGIAYGVLLVLGGRLGDAYGRRRMFVAGLTLFTLTSLVCGLAPTAGLLVAARAAQGAAAALMVPQVLATIQAATTTERRSRAVGWYGATSGLSMIVGQVLGGLLVSSDIAGLGWRTIFLVNVPIGLVGLVLARRAMPETRAARPVAVDRVGTPLLSGLILALLLPLMEGATLGWPLWTWLLLAAAPVLAVAFVTTQRRAERAGRTPLVPPSVVGMPSMRRGLLLTAPFFVGFGAFMFVYAVTLQDGLGLDPFSVGLAISPMAAAFLTASLVSSRLVLRYGQGVVTMGAALQAVGVAIMTVTTLVVWPDLHVTQLAPGMLVAGFGQGLVMTTMFRVVLSRVPTDRAGVGSGILTTTQQVSLAAGVATLGSAYLWLSDADVLGARYAFALIMLCQVVGAIAIVVASRKLPDPRG